MKKVFYLFFILISIPVFSQNNKWVKHYKPKFQTKVIDTKKLTEHYDSGFVMSGYYGNPEGSAWIKKTDVNGNELWTKEVKNSASDICFFDHAVDQKGAIYAGGRTDYLKEGDDACVVKFNACGEVEWGKILEGNFPLGYCTNVLITKEGNCLLILNYHKEFKTGELMAEGTPLSVFCFSPEGNLLWRHYCRINKYGCSSQFVGHTCLLSNGELFFSGFVYKSKQDNSGVLKELAMLCGAKGEVKWLNVADSDEFNEDYVFRRSFCGIESDNLKNIYQGVYFRNIKDQTWAGLIKWDKKGKLIEKKLVGEKPKRGQLNYIEFVNDQLLMCDYSFNPLGSDLTMPPLEAEKRNRVWNYNSRFTETKNKRDLNPGYAILMDTLGNIKKKKSRETMYAGHICQTSDHKFLFYGPIEIKNKIYTVLEKYNANLEYDSIYTQTREYDYLCDRPIESEKFDFSNLVVVDLKESPLKKELKSLKAYPNPFHNYIQLQLPEYIQKEQESKGVIVTHQQYNYHVNSYLEVVNIKGQKIFTKLLIAGQKEVRFDTSTWRKGIYLIRLISENNVAAKVKVIK
ncbi:MAG: T9SS type A sorting domain-containing protein [Bacteroidales bacterium]